MTIADVDQGGLGLPDKSYYHAGKRRGETEKYVAHICAHVSADRHRRQRGRRKAKAVLALETHSLKHLSIVPHAAIRISCTTR